MDTYNFENKHIYRERREVVIDRMVDKPIGIRKVAYLDTKEALDTLSYLKRGYKAENLWAVNNNPAEMALLTMKLQKMGLPKINTVGLDFFEALNKKIPFVDVIDFDGMSNLNKKTHKQIGDMVEDRPNSVYGLTVLAGREAKGTLYNNWIKNLPNLISRWPKCTSFGTVVNENHVKRLFMILNWVITHIPDGHSDGEGEIPFVSSSRCKVHINKMYWDVYMSISRQPMLWVVCKCEKHNKKPDKREMRRIGENTNWMYIPKCYRRG